MDKCQNHSEHEARIDILENETEKLRTKVDVNAERLSTVEGSSKSAHNRLNKIESLTESIHEISGTLKLTVEQNGQILTTLRDHDTKIQILDKASGKAALVWVDRVLNFVVLSLLAYLASKL